jgi:hypothetical protein
MVLLNFEIEKTWTHYKIQIDLENNWAYNGKERYNDKENMQKAGQLWK